MNIPTTLWGHVIDGQMLDAGMDPLQGYDPATGAEGYRYARGGAPEVAAAVAAAKAAQPAWADLRPIRRGRVLGAIAQGLRADPARFARIDQAETGRHLTTCLAEVELAAQYFEFYAGLVNTMGGEGIDLGAQYHSYTRHEPYGVVAIITPWNSPLTQLARGLAPALAMGNAVVAKPSEFTSAATVALGLACVDWGLPAGLFNVVTGLGAEAGAALVAHEGVRMVAFTGSVRAGRMIGAKAAERIIPVSLELGGKSANIVFDDCDIAAAVAGAVAGFTANAGQLCSAGSRILVQSGLHDAFVDRLKAALATIRVGRAESCTMGPIITSPQYEKVTGLLARARAEGVNLHQGGILDQTEGWFVPPTLILGLDNGHPLSREEIFGPVASVIRFDTEDEAIAIANDSDYGLVGGVWTQNLSRALRVAGRIEAGQVFVNEYFAGGVETPFGGYKQSGIGREKGRAALHHYGQIKTVTLRL